MFTFVDSSGLQVDGVDGLVVGPGADGEEWTARATSPRRRVRGLLPGAAVERTEATAAGLSRADDGPTVDDAATKLNLLVDREANRLGKRSV